MKLMAAPPFASFEAWEARTLRSKALIGPSEVWKLKNIHDDQRDVILLAHRRRAPSLEFGEQLARQLRGRLQSMIAHDPFQLPVAKRFSHSVLRFAHPIGVEQEAIGSFNRHAAHRVRSIGFDSEEQSVTFDALYFAARIPPAQ
jgi:hypothetical protein